ncbi:MAG: LuxR C-terminal-related transcriptional regulator [Bryobacteraceae bacterium]
MQQAEQVRPIRLYLVDDHALFREGLVRLFAGDEGLEVVGASSSAADALQSLLDRPIDVLILDYDLGSESVIDFVRQLRESGFTGKILMVTAGLPDKDALVLIRFGVSGIFHKQDRPSELRRSIQEVFDGKVLIDQLYLQKLAQAAFQSGGSSVRLTARDRQVLRFLIEGLANKEIAAQLDISESAVKASLQQLFAKTGVRTRSQLVRVALEQFRDEL